MLVADNAIQPQHHLTNFNQLQSEGLVRPHCGHDVRHVEHNQDVS